MSRRHAVLTVDLDRLRVGPGDVVLDMGCGGGRHAYAALRRGARVLALDADAEELTGVSTMTTAMQAEGEVPHGAAALPVRGDALALPLGGRFHIPHGVITGCFAGALVRHAADARAADFTALSAAFGFGPLTPRALADRLDAILPAASRLAKHHVSYGVEPKHYAPVGDALLWTLEKGLGPDWTPELAEAWGAAYGTLSGYMIDQAYGRGAAA